MTHLDDLLALTDAVKALVEPRTHVEPYSVLNGVAWLRRKHRTEVASLIEQLGEAIEPSGSGASGHAVPASRPAARLEAIDVLLAIDVETSQWVDLLGMDSRGSVADNLRLLLGQAWQLDDDVLSQLAGNALRWVTRASVLTGWEVPAWRPDSTCPLCSVRGGLRVRAGDGVTSTEVSATCVACGECWTPQTVGLLAEHIRSENDDHDTQEATG